jgi:hypothetical protein
MQNKKPRNENCQKHGRWELYYCGGLNRLTNYVNGVAYGYYYYAYFNTTTPLIIYFAK